MLCGPDTEQGALCRVWGTATSVCGAQAPPTPSPEHQLFPPGRRPRVNGEEGTVSTHWNCFPSQEGTR